MNIFWDRLIKYKKNEKEISFGLTIPYLVGANEIINNDLISKDDGIKRLIHGILNSKSEYVAVIQKCSNIRKYVIGIESLDKCNFFFKNDIQIYNSNKEPRIIITVNAKDLGNNIENIISKFNELYLDSIIESKYTWDYKIKEWTYFSEYEKNQIISIYENQSI